MALITGVDAGSPAARAALRAGQSLLAISGHPIRDVLDYRFYSYDAHLTMTLSEGGGAPFDTTLIKGEGEDPGLSFETGLMDGQRCCGNQCIFCFVDQLPSGLRQGLYFKDDDARLSFLYGQYITLTNLTEEEMDRVVRMRISPLHISVHATDPDLRVRLLGHPNAGRCLPMMRRLADAGIQMHAQVVVCPGHNDGEALEHTLEDLLELCPAVRSVSVVPVGLTRWRQGLFPLKPLDARDAGRIIRLVDTMAERCLTQHGFGGVYSADELYLLAGLPLPPEQAYDGYPQLQNGVGLLTSFQNEFEEALGKYANRSLPCATPFTVATGRLAAPFLSRLLDQLDALAITSPQARSVVAVPNRLFGETVTVAGLLCGRDLIEALRGQVIGNRVLIPDSMLRHGGDIFLDDLTPDDVASAIGAEVVAVPVDGHSFLRSILKG